LTKKTAIPGAGTGAMDDPLEPMAIERAESRSNSPASHTATHDVAAGLHVSVGMNSVCPMRSERSRDSDDFDFLAAKLPA
jgi:hypothetical protein